jgi:hypothetical protein
MNLREITFLLGCTLAPLSPRTVTARKPHYYLSDSTIRKDFEMRFWIFLVTSLVIAPALPAQTDKSAKTAAETIAPEDIARHVGVMAHDSMMGRDTPSRGLEMTARYVADQFAKVGLKPAGNNGTWFQRYPVGNDTITAPNAIGLLEGSDPKLEDEYIVFTAHMDHIGVRSGDGDSIYNGADDNASGTAGVIALARAFSQAGVRPRGSLLFLVVSGEEKGFWGSSYYVEHPTVPMEQIVADVNLDMVGRSPGDSVEVWGVEGSKLADMVQRIAAAHPELRLTITIKGDDSGSDQVSFKKFGIPWIYPYTGEHPDYHQPSDSPEKIHTDAEARILRLTFYMAQDVANADQRPK